MRGSTGTKAKASQAARRLVAVALLCATTAAAAGCGKGGSGGATGSARRSSSSSSAATSSASRTGAAGAGARRRGSSESPAKAGSGGGASVPAATARMQVSSPAFARGGTIPARYTCDGSNFSPPLRWSNVPKGAAELVLFVLDEDSVGAEGGIRWVLGGIDPSSHGVAAGSLPKGALAGRNTAGQAEWGGICPRSGQTHLIMVVLYALKHRIPLSPGFVPAVAEQRFPSDAIALAKTFGYYKRRG